MYHRADRGAAGGSATFRKLALIIVLTGLYASIGWIGPGTPAEFTAFYTRYPFLLFVLILTTAIATITLAITCLVLLSSLQPIQRRKARSRDIGPPAQEKPLPRRPPPSPSRPFSLRDAMPAIHREGKRLLVAAFASMAIHAAITLFSLLRQPYDIAASIAYSLAVVTPFLAWAFAALIGYVLRTPLFIGEKNPATASIPPSDKEPRRKGILVASIACWTCLVTALAFTPLPYIAILAAGLGGIDAALRVMEYKKK